jgi:ZIP family zinc transporter
VIEAGVWAFVGASSLIVGALIAFVRPLADRPLGLVLAFGAGVLLSAVAYELVAEAADISDPGLLTAFGFAAGAVTFYIGSEAISRMGGGTAGGERPAGRLVARRDPRAQGSAIVLGAVLDGIPESIVLGLTLIGSSGVSVALLVSIFISNVPEAIGASAELERGGISRPQILGLWALVAVASGVAAMLGYGLLSGAPRELVAAVDTFAAGAIIAMLSETMIPEAYEKGGRAVGLATALGFAVSAGLSFAT